MIDWLSGSASAIGGAASHLDGSAIGAVWSIPFAGLLLSIALLPLAAPHFWEHHFGKVASLWALIFLLPCAVVFGARTAATETMHVLLLDYFPFIILLFALFVVAGGIRVSGNLVGTPATNTAMLGFGTLVASLFGTTGAAMLMIRPLIQANRHRQHKVQTFVFFIFLVCNIGGSLTPLGPPLFLGFLKGVDFYWTVKHMLWPMLFVSGLLLALFYLIDRRAWNRESGEVREKSGGRCQIRIEGAHNIIYLAVVVDTVLFSGLWDRGVTVPVGLVIEMPLNGLVRDSTLLFISYLSWKTTRRPIRVENAFTWLPIQEVATLFAAIFITMIPVLAMLRAGHQGALAPLLGLVSTPDGQPIRGRLFLADRCSIELPRQRADLSRLLQLGRRRRANADGTARRYLACDFGRRRVHGRQYLYRQRARISWCDRSARSMASRCRASSASCRGRERSCCRSSPPSPSSGSYEQPGFTTMK